MKAALALARAYGVRVRFADLGSWGAAELRSEYDPRGPEIRINQRVAGRLAGAERRRFVALAVAHELYHHREHAGEIAIVADRAERERAAGRFAAELLREPA